MPGTASAVGDSGICHVTPRGIDRHRIFGNDESRDRFPEIRMASKEKDGSDPVARRLTPVHVRLPIHEKEVILNFF